MALVDQIDITACDREPIHLPGSIQPHGVLLIADRESLEVEAGAGDIAGRLTLDWLGVTLSELLGQSLELAREELAGSTSNIAVLDRVVGFTETFDAVARLSGEWLIVELEPAPIPMPSGKRLLALTAISAAFDRTVDLKTLCDAAAIAFRKLTGFDRVMIYRFLDDDAGNVVAEDSSPESARSLTIISPPLTSPSRPARFTSEISSASSPMSIMRQHSSTLAPIGTAST